MKSVPPIRLRDDPRAPRLLRADLARASQLPAVAFDAARGLAALDAAIQAGGAPAAPFAAPATASKALAVALAKGALVGLVTVGVAGVSSMWLDRRDAAPPPRVAAIVASTAVEGVPQPASPPLPGPAEDPPTAARASAPPSPPSGSAARRPGPHAAESSAVVEAPAPPAPSGASQLQEEMENLVRLRAAATADPQQALALAEEGRRRFPSGQYAQEREVLAISALVRLGRRGEAEARARAFVAAYPRSHLVERIRALTGAPEKE